MVSFQCHSCGDVVKKPKLDQHNSRCHSGFDCIDCSKTFNSPGEWKGHTSCISEAEKYQKSLYKGPKTGEQQYGNHYQINGSAGPGPGRGGHAGICWDRGGGYSNGWQKDRGTGANTTPLGTPARMSPAALPSPVDNTPSTSQSKDAPPSKQSTTEIVQEVVPKSQGKEKRKKDESKKRKSPAPDADLTTSAGAEPTKKAKLPEIAEGSSKPEKKKRKTSGREEEISEKNEGRPDGEMSKKDKKERKKSKKSTAADPLALDDSIAAIGEGDRTARTKGEQSDGVELVATEESKSKKRKRSRTDQGPAAVDEVTAGDSVKNGKATDTSVADGKAAGEKAQKKSKKGKSVAEVPSESVQADAAAQAPGTNDAEISTDSKKKRKRSQVDETNAPTTEPSPKEKNSRKSKKTNKPATSDVPQSEAAILGDSNALPDTKSVLSGDVKVKKDKKSKKDKKETAASTA